MSKKEVSQTKISVNVAQLKRDWRRLKAGIQDRLDDFARVGRTAGDNELFAELAFCLFTPQSKATSCWATVNDLVERDLLLTGTGAELARRLNRVRFRNNKARYVVEARRLFSAGGRLLVRSKLSAFSDDRELREWLVENVTGMGYKEASHFLRNIGRGEKIAILDRHILKNLKFLGVVTDIPSSLGKKTYLAIEDKMTSFATRSGIPLNHLDLLLWCRETGAIFK